MSGRACATALSLTEYDATISVCERHEWLGRKDSNLQPSDPESAALPLRHSPSPSSARAGANHSKDVPVVGRLVLAGALGARAHADRQRLLRTHHLPETLLHERFRSMELDR